MSWQLLAILAAGVLAIAVIAWEVVHHLDEITAALFGARRAPPPERWRRVHIEGDQARPFERNGRRIG